MRLDYIDIHSHMNLSPLLENQEAVLTKMQNQHIGTITVGTGLETSQEALNIAEKNPDFCFATVGIHPTDSDEIFNEQVFLELAQHPKTVAIGETGLDYFRDHAQETKQRQIELFKKHIDLALRVDKPLMLHVRASKGSDDAYYDALNILKSYDRKDSFSLIGAFFSLVGSLGHKMQLFVAGASEREKGACERKEPTSLRKSASADRVEYLQLRANFHFFSGSKKCMEDIVAAGFTISVDGPITFSSDYDEMIKAVPIDKIMIETDAPFAAPTPYRGKTCEPWMVVEVARKIAELKQLELEDVRKQILQNSIKFFNL